VLKVTSGVYAITNLVTGFLYIGSSKHIEKRFSDHKKDLTRGKHVNRHLQSSVNKHGIDNFEFKVIHEVNCDRNTLYQYEKLFTLSEDPCKLYNMICPVQFYSESQNYQDFLERRVKTWKETVRRNGGLPPHDDGRKRNQSAAVSGEKNGFFGQTHKTETILKLKAKAKERWKILEERLLQSERLKKYFENPEARARVGSKSKGRRQPLEQNRKKSEMFSGSGNPNAQPFILNGVRYGSFKEAELALGLSKYKIKKLLKPNDYLERE
jgi:group I intron endonuclease